MSKTHESFSDSFSLTKSRNAITQTGTLCTDLTEGKQLEILVDNYQRMGLTGRAQKLKVAKTVGRIIYNVEIENIDVTGMSFSIFVFQDQDGFFYSLTSTFPGSVTSRVIRDGRLKELCQIETKQQRLIDVLSEVFTQASGNVMSIIPAIPTLQSTTKGVKITLVPQSIDLVRDTTARHEEVASLVAGTVTTELPVLTTDIVKHPGIGKVIAGFQTSSASSPNESKDIVSFRRM